MMTGDKCMACGGPVGDDGMYAEGGEVEESKFEPEGVINEGLPKSQDVNSDDMRRSAQRAFVRAVKGGGR